MKKKEETNEKKPTPVMKQLARQISTEELAAVNGAGSTTSNVGDKGDIDYQW